MNNPKCLIEVNEDKALSAVVKSMGFHGLAAALECESLLKAMITEHGCDVLFDAIKAYDDETLLDLCKEFLKEKEK